MMKAIIITAVIVCPITTQAHGHAPDSWQQYEARRHRQEQQQLQREMVEAIEQQTDAIERANRDADERASDIQFQMEMDAIDRMIYE